DRCRACRGNRELSALRGNNLAERLVDWIYADGQIQSTLTICFEAGEFAAIPNPGWCKTLSAARWNESLISCSHSCQFTSTSSASMRDASIQSGLISSAFSRESSERASKLMR